jgi:hypothetical protein
MMKLAEKLLEDKMKKVAGLPFTVYIRPPATNGLVIYIYMVSETCWQIFRV